MRFKTNSMYYQANQYWNYPTDLKELENIDCTDMFYKELERHIDEMEIIKIQINSKPRMGKSTVGVTLAYHIFKLLKKKRKIHQNQEFTVKNNIAMDQMDFDFKMRDPNTTFTAIAVDEENQSEKTGQDVTVIQALQEDQSNIQADRYVHTVYSSPRSITDPNADIILYIISKDEKTGKTLAKLYYRWFEEQQDRQQLLGYVIINVNDIVKNWTKKVREIYYDKLKEKNPEKKQKYEKTIKKWEKKDWYVEYYMKKRKKIELVTKYKISKPRVLKYAPIILKVINVFKDLMKLSSFVKKDMVQNNVKMEMRKAGMPQSIVGEELTTREVMGVLEGYNSYWKIKEQQRKLRNNKKLERVQIITFNEQLEETAKTIRDNTHEMINEYERCIELNKEYEKEYGI